MLKNKRVVAIALAVIMVLGSSMTALADNSGTLSGSGITEGHVEKSVTNVVLPTVASSDLTFTFIMDPERLMSATANAKYQELGITKFPAAESDTGVYFMVSANELANTSNTLSVENRSSHDVNLTVQVELEAGANDIALTDDKTFADATEAQLYLGLLVGSEDEAAITGNDGASVTVPISGNADNFEVQYNSSSKLYEYAVKDDADGWETTSFQLTGACTSDIAIESTTTAPTVKVTWSWTVDANPSVVSDLNVIEAGEPAVIKIDLGAGDLAATDVVEFKWDGVNYLGAAGGNLIVWDAEAQTITIDATIVANLVDYPELAVFDIVFDNDYVLTVTLGLKE